MDVLVVDSGARGHALAWKLARSPECGQVFVAPGNPGVQEIADIARSPDGEPIAVKDTSGLLNFAKSRGDSLLTIPVTEEILGDGIVDKFIKEGLSAWGPTKAAAEIETSKLIMKQIAEQRGVPTANYEIFDSYQGTWRYLQNQIFPLVLKADGLAQGKGVKVCEGLEIAKHALDELREEGHLNKGKIVLVEEYLEGPEISLHAWCDGDTYRMFPFAMQDHKTIYADDKGPMTGGMGVVGPVPGISRANVEQLGKVFVEPFLAALKELGHPFKGVLYPGIKLTPTGPKLLELNARPGDPETQVWASLLQSSLLEIMLACNEGKLTELPPIKWRKSATACIVLAAKGYPSKTEKGATITGLDTFRNIDNILVFQGGTKTDNNGQLIVNGGRVLNVVAVGEDNEPLPMVIQRGYEAAEHIRFDNKRPQIRHDIGEKALSSNFQNYVKIMRNSLAT